MRTPTLGLMGMLLGALVAGLGMASPATAVTTAACDLTPSTWVRAELVDRQGRPSGRFVDSRLAGRTLTVDLGGRFHYLRHVGVDTPRTGLEMVYTDSASAAEWHRESTTTGRSGAFASEPLDLRGLLAPGARLTVGVHHAAGQPSVAQDLIEYALLAAAVP